jgi:TolB protein
VAGEGNIQVLDLKTGGVTQLTSDPWDDSDPVWSPSDDRVAYATRSPDSSTTLIKIMSASGDSLMTIGQPGTHAGYPAWAPNDDRIAFVWNVTGNSELYTINADGSNLRRLTNTPADEELRPAWSPHGDKIIFDRGDEQDLNGRRLWTIAPNGTGEREIETGGAYEFHAAYSPDGKRIAFSSRRTGNTEVFVSDSSGANAERLTVIGAEDGDPWWTADGLALIFSSTRGGLRHLYKMQPNGSGTTQLTSTTAQEYDPAVSR